MRSILYASLFAWLLGASLSSAQAADRAIEFNRDIRPILSDNCFSCHGPDKNSRKAKLRLDTREGAFGLIDGIHPVVAGKPEESEMHRRITTSDPEDHMPPPKSGKQLTPEQIALLTEWIKAGAPWQGHWAYIPPKRPALPDLAALPHAGWARNPIDLFLLRDMAPKGLAPSPEADRRTLYRRLSYDLIGLPPSPEEVDRFMHDRDPQAYEKLVDHLLASPRYGERMAVNWLDLVRYADSVGFHGDQERSVYAYRDYVIKAFNADMPFDQFTIEQLGGDLLPDATRPQRIASGYNRLNETTEEGGAQAKEYLAKYAADRVRTTSTTWMGATLGCAQCHDHKFDPYTSKDFYSFGAFFADIKEEGVGDPEGTLLPNPKQQKQLDAFDEKIASLQKTLDTTTPEIAAAQRQWESDLRAEQQDGHLGWQTLQPEQMRSEEGARLETLPDFSILVSGENPTNDNYTVTYAANRGHVTALRLEALTHPSLDHKGFSRGGGNFVLTEFEVALVSNGQTNDVKIQSAAADYEQGGFPVRDAIDGKPDTGWAVDGSSQQTDRHAVFTFRDPIEMGPGTRLIARLKHTSKYKNHNLGHFRLSLISIDRPTRDEHGVPKDVFEALQVPKRKQDDKQRGLLAGYFRGIYPALDEPREEFAGEKKARADLVKTIPTTLMSVSVEPRVMRILPRGNWMDDSGEVVTPAVPAFLGPTPCEGKRATRLDLGRWLVSRDNPLTARVFVNRLWKRYFGIGICKNLDDLGSQGEWPRHPELLDWLAVEFMDSGWDIKHVIRLIVTSSAYRQSSHADEGQREIDPYNRYVARQSSFRYDAEMIRDNALAVSGLLSERMGGPSARPYQPDGYWDQLNFPKREYHHDHGENEYRRGVYTHWQRTFLHPSLRAFDAPTREECTAERPRSNTPLQALVLLNDPTYVEAARVLAAHIMKRGGDSFHERLDWSFQRALDRSPKREEESRLRELFAAQLDRYRADAGAAEELVSSGEWAIPAQTDIPELAAWTSVARVLLNLHESITRY